MVREGYKETELGEIPVNWEVRSLEECLLEHHNISIPPHPDCRYLGLEHLETGSNSINGFASSTEVKSNVNSFSKGHILYGKLRPYLDKGVIATFSGLCSMEIIVLVERENVDRAFVFNHLHSSRFIQFASSNSYGTKMPRTSFKVIGSYRISLPPLPEQRRIAAVLSIIDEAIEKTEALIDKLRQVNAGLMQDLLTKGIDEEGRVRSEETHAFKDSEIGRVPAEWEIVKIDQVKARRKNAIAMGPFGSDITVDNFVESGIPVIRGQNLATHYVNGTGFVYISPKKADQLAACNACKDDIVITHRGTIGQVSIIPQDSKYDRYVVSQSQMKLTCDANLANPYFVNFYFNSELGRRRLLFRAGYTGVPAIGQPITSLKGLFVPKPGLMEQRRINSILYAADDRIAREEAFRDKLLAMKKGLMADLLTGRVRVPEGVAG